VAALVAIAVVVVALPHVGRSAPAPTSPAWPRIGALRPQPRHPVEDVTDAGSGVLYGTVRRGGRTVAVGSLDGGATWTVTGPPPCAAGALVGLAFADPIHGVATCESSQTLGPQGTSSYELTADGGASWAANPALGEPGDVMPQSPDTWSPVAAGHGSLWALSWRCTRGQPGQSCQRYLATSTDGGQSWATSSLALGSQGVAIGYLPSALASLQVTGPHSGYLLSTGNGTPLALYRTHDDWQSWTSSPVPCADGGSFAGSYQLLAVTPSVLYLWCDSTQQVLYRSSDAGHSWQLRSSSIPVSFTTANPDLLTVFAAAGPSTLFLQGAGTLVRSDDAGATWHPVIPGLRATWLHFAYADVGVLLDESGTGSRFGWFVTSDAGATWTHPPLP
jgi:photosystem II stability/assembly factor-like uncharacterized protein